LEVLRLEKLEREGIEDSFDWETGIINQIKQWVKKQGLTVEEAFKCFDKDFDGFISKGDLKDSLIEIIEVDPSTIHATKLDRLFRLMDFFKTGMVQVSDFQRLMVDANPYRESMVKSATANMSKSLGGGL
jgi:hypothetical protein